MSDRIIGHCEACEKPIYIYQEFSRMDDPLTGDYLMFHLDCPCDCKPDCGPCCKGECGCQKCHDDYQDFLSCE